MTNSSTHVFSYFGRVPCARTYNLYNVLVLQTNHCRAFAEPESLDDLLDTRIDGRIMLERLNTTNVTRNYKIVPYVFTSGAERNCQLALEMGPTQRLQVCLSAFSLS